MRFYFVIQIFIFILFKVTKIQSGPVINKYAVVIASCEMTLLNASSLYLELLYPQQLYRSFIAMPGCRLAFSTGYKYRRPINGITCFIHTDAWMTFSIKQFSCPIVYFILPCCIVPFLSKQPLFHMLRKTNLISTHFDNKVNMIILKSRS